MSTDPSVAAYEALPEDVASWLQGQGWQRLGPGHADRPALWRSGERELLQPTLRDASDYELRLTQMLQRLATWTDRSPEALTNEMIYEGADVSEWRANGAHARDFSVPLEDGLQLVQSVRNVFVAAANAAITRRGYFGQSSLKVARTHARVVRMGQTRRGSYVVPIISRIPGALAASDERQGSLDVDVIAQPYERRVMVQLAEALSTVQRLAVSSGSSPSPKDLNESVANGVSHELCAGIGHALAAESFGDIDVTFHWARRGARHPEIERVLFPKASQPIVERMAASLRGSEVVAEQRLAGWIHQLNPSDEADTIKVRAAIGQKSRIVTAVLTPEQMHEALMAADERRPVYIRGRLLRAQGKTWYFDSVSEFGVTDHAPLEWAKVRDGSANPRVRHVIADPADGRWHIELPGSSRRAGSFKSQTEAVNHARQILRNVGGGELVIHAADGAIVQVDAVEAEAVVPGDDGSSTAG